MRTTGFFLEHAKAGAKASSGVGKQTQSWVSVHTKLGQTMPVSQIEQNRENVCIVGLWQKAIKNGYRALGGVWPLVWLELVNDSTYLQHILIIMSGHLLQFRPVRSYSPYAISSKRWDFSKPNRKSVPSEQGFN
jgi:hypothetical protein